MQEVQNFNSVKQGRTSEIEIQFSLNPVDIDCILLSDNQF